MPYNLFARTCRVKYTHITYTSDAPVRRGTVHSSEKEMKESEYSADLSAIDGLSSVCIAGALITRNYIWKGGS